MERPEFEVEQLSQRVLPAEKRPLLEKLWNNLEFTLGAGFWITGAAGYVSFSIATFGISSGMIHPEILEGSSKLLNAHVGFGTAYLATRIIRWGAGILRDLDTLVHH